MIKTALRRAMIPSEQATFTCCDIIDIMNEEFGIHILPVVLRAHEEYYVIDEDQALSACTIRYKIPYRSVGNKLRDVQFVDNAGTQYEMTRVSLESRPEYQGNYTNNQFLTFYLENDSIVLMQNQISNGNIRSSYYLRPNELVKIDRGATIISIATTPCLCGPCCSACGKSVTVFTVDAVPTHFSLLCACTCIGILYDFVQGKSPNKIIGFDRCITAICSTLKTITFVSCDLTTIDLFSITPQALTFAAGDYITTAEESIVPQLPTELHPLLAQRTAIKMLEALGDTEGMRNAQQELERMEYNVMALIDNRVEGAPQKITNRHSILKSSLSNKLYRRRGL